MGMVLDLSMGFRAKLGDICPTGQLGGLAAGSPNGRLNYSEKKFSAKIACMVGLTDDLASELGALTATLNAGLPCPGAEGLNFSLREFPVAEWGGHQ